MQETSVWSLGWKDYLEKEKATHSSILAYTVHGVTKSQDMTETFTSSVHYIPNNEEL